VRPLNKARILELQKKKERKKENRRHREIRRKLIHLGLGWTREKNSLC